MEETRLVALKVSGVMEIVAYMCSDNYKTYILEEAEKRQQIINRGDMPCPQCQGQGKFVPDPTRDPYPIECLNCKSRGYLVKKIIWE